MFIKSLNSVEVKESDALPKWMKEMQNSYCFFTVGEMVATCISTNHENIQDFKDALDEFEKHKRENPDKCIIVKDTNSDHVYISYTPTYQLPHSCRPQSFAIDVLNQLKRLKLVNNNVQESNWLYTFGYDAPNTQSKINWLGTKENLRLFLTLWYETELRSKEIKHKTIHDFVPFCFFKDGEPMYLAKAKPENSPIPALIEKIFRTNEND